MSLTLQQSDVIIMIIIRRTIFLTVNDYNSIGNGNNNNNFFNHLKCVSSFKLVYFSYDHCILSVVYYNCSVDLSLV